MSRQSWSRHVLLVAAVVAQLLPTPVHAEEETRLKTVVIGLAARRGIDPGLAAAMSDIVQGEFAAERHRMVFGRADISRLMEFEAEKQLVGCDTDSCLSEIASALDVDRIVTGSIDKIGSAYFVVINELESDGVAPIGRIQGRVPLDEDRLFRAVAAMSRDLIAQTAHLNNKRKVRDATSSNTTPKPAGVETPIRPTPPPIDRRGTKPPKPPAIARGLTVTSAVPATVRIGTEDYGATPVTIADLPAGDYTVQLMTEAGDPLVLDVTVYDDGVTQIETEYDRQLKPAPEALEKYEEDKLWNNVTAISKIGGGSAVAFLGAPCLSLVPLLAISDINVGAPVTLTVCGIVGVAGCGLIGWGILDFILPPEAPQGEGVGTEVVIKPPAGKGDQRTIGIPRSQAMPH